jgi:hypothetical protein
VRQSGIVVSAGVTLDVAAARAALDHRLDALGRDAHRYVAAGKIATALLDIEHRAVAKDLRKARRFDRTDACGDVLAGQLDGDMVLIGQERPLRRLGGLAASAVGAPLGSACCREHPMTSISNVAPTIAQRACNSPVMSVCP